MSDEANKTQPAIPAQMRKFSALRKSQTVPFEKPSQKRRLKMPYETTYSLISSDNEGSEE